MSSKNHTFVKYIGADYYPDTYTSYFKQFNHSGIFHISDPKYPIKDLLVVNAKPTLTLSKLLSVSRDNLSDELSPFNYSLLVQGDIMLSIQYTTHDMHDSIYYDKHILSFSEYISLPNILSSDTHFSAKILIEDIYSYIMSPEYLYHNITLLISAHPC